MSCVVGQGRLIKIPIASHGHLPYTEPTPKGRREGVVAFGNCFLPSFQFNWQTVCRFAKQETAEQVFHLLVWPETNRYRRLWVPSLARPILVEYS